MADIQTSGILHWSALSLRLVRFTLTVWRRITKKCSFNLQIQQVRGVASISQKRKRNQNCLENRITSEGKKRDVIQ